MDDILKTIIDLQKKYTNETDFSNDEEMCITLDSISFVSLIIEIEDKFNVELNDLFLLYPEVSIKSICSMIKQNKYHIE